MQAFPHASSSANAVVLFNPPSLPNFHQHLSPAWTIPLQGYGYQAQTPAPSYPHLLNTLHPVDVNPLVHGSRFPHFPFNDGQISWPRHTQHAAPDFRRESVGILSSEVSFVPKPFFSWFLSVLLYYTLGNTDNSTMEPHLVRSTCRTQPLYFEGTSKLSFESVFESCYVVRMSACLCPCNINCMVS